MRRWRPRLLRRDRGREPLFVVCDPDDPARAIALWPGGWHYVARKPERQLTPGLIRRGIEERVFRVPDPLPDRERLYSAGIGPTSWLFVVVEWSGNEGRVYNAIPVRRLSRRDRQ